MIGFFFFFDSFSIFVPHGHNHGCHLSLYRQMHVIQIIFLVVNTPDEPILDLFGKYWQGEFTGKCILGNSKL